MKNHGTGPCTNPYIPDNENWTYAMPETEIGATASNLGQFKKNEIINLGKSPTGNGAQGPVSLNPKTSEIFKFICIISVKKNQKLDADRS